MWESKHKNMARALTVRECVAWALAVILSLPGSSAHAAENAVVVPSSISADSIAYGTLTIGEGLYEAEGIRGPATFCSNARWVCVKGDLINLVLPRDCETAMRDGPWSLGETATHILFRKSGLPELHGGGSGTTLYLGNPDFPYVVYEYDPLVGITYIFWDRERKINFASLAAAGALEKWMLNWFTDPEKRRLVFQKERGKYLGRCG